MGRYSLPSAEYFEVLVAHRLADRFGVPTNATSALVQSKFVPDSREIDRANAAVDRIANHLSERGCLARQVEWIGGKRSAEGVAADIRVLCGKGGAVSYQLKSVGGGTGTIRNLGLPIAARRLDADVSKVVRAARIAVTDAAQLAGFKVASIDSWSGLAKFRKTLAPASQAKLDHVAKLAYEPFKRSITNALVEAFNKASTATKVKFALDALGVVPEQAVFLVIADNARVRVLSTEPLVAALRGDPLHAEVYESGNSLVISAGGVPYLRLNSSATNHQGLSNPCVRLFHMRGAEVLFAEFGIPIE